MKSGTKKTVVAIVLLAVLGGGVWYAFQAGWFKDTGPNNLPTAQELERIRAIEESSSRKAPDAKTGVGVRPPGTLPSASVESTATGTPPEGTVPSL